MEIQPKISTFGATQNTVLNTGTSRETLSSDFDTFLKMLTVQVENQDPLNPVDATDYATQLATFSAVEQQIKTNELLQVISKQSGIGALQSYGGWIGMEALVEAPVRFEGKPIQLRPEFFKDSDSAQLVVRSDSGAEINRRMVSQSDTHISWDGRNKSGSPAAAGNYSFSLESFKNNELIDTRTIPAYSRIDEIRAVGSNAILRFSGGEELAASEVNGLRNP